MRHFTFIIDSIYAPLLVSKAETQYINEG